MQIHRRRFIRISFSSTFWLAVAALSLAAQTEASIVITSDLYVSTGFASGQILDFTPSGAQSTFASGLNLPYGIAFDHSGDLFEADYGTKSIYKFAPNGTRSTFASGLNRPVGLAFDSNGNLFEADSSDLGGPYSIYEFTPSGTKTLFASGLSYPVGLAFDQNGNLYESDGGPNQNNGHIYKFTPAGARSTVASGLNVVCLTFDSADNLFYSDEVANSIVKITPDGTRSTFASGLHFPYGLAFDPSGNLFEADGYNGESGTSNGHIYEFAPDGTRSTFASGLLDADFVAFAPVPEPSGCLLAIACAAAMGLIRLR